MTIDPYRATGHYRVAPPTTNHVGHRRWDVLDPQGCGLGFDCATEDGALRVASRLNRDRLLISKLRKEAA